MARISALLRSAPKPVLIHCQSGADRSGLVAALYEYTIAARPLEEAQEQLSLLFGHFPYLWSRTGAMDEVSKSSCVRIPQSQAPERREGSRRPSASLGSGTRSEPLLGHGRASPTR